MINRIAAVGLILVVACRGGGDGIGPTTASSDITNMAVGEVRVLNPADIQNGIDLQSVSSPRDYVIIVGNTNPQHDVVASYFVKADKSTGSFGVSAAPEVSAQSSRLIDQIPLARTPQQSIENRVRSFERRNLTLRSRQAPVGISGFSVRRSTLAAVLSVPLVGDKINLKIPDASTNNLCTNYIQTQAEVASVSQRAIIVVDTLDGPPALLFTQAQMDSITQEFDNITYPTELSYYNNPTDIDGNSRIIMLFTGQINKLTPPQTQGGFIGGFFFAGDFFPPTGTTPGTFCPQSNEAEIFYLLSPDPTGKFGNVRTTASVRQGTRGTIAHEFQHMINAGNRYQNPAVSDFESTWLDEALSHVAEDAVGRVSRSFGDLQTLTFNDLVPCNTPCSQANDFNAFFFQNLARLTYWMDKPNQYSPISDLADTSLATRGAAWAIVRYAADNYSAAAPRALTRKLAAGPDTGVRNFSAAAQAPIDTLVAGWLVSMYADHFGISGLDPKYVYRSYNFRDVMPPVAKSVLGTSTATYPLRVLAIGSGSDNISSTNRSAGGGTYYRLNVAANAGPKNVKILDTAGNVANFPGEHIYVLRVQ
ncbi:MAG: hypothetical protein M3P26_05870 [Gemmatimonadota bacterium]|nr:hypothetical protein [Gemmatimonadota bacterium]